MLITCRTCFRITIVTRIHAKWYNLFSEPITFNISKPMQRAISEETLHHVHMWELQSKCNHEREKKLVPMIINTKAKATGYFGEFISHYCAGQHYIFCIHNGNWISIPSLPLPLFFREHVLSWLKIYAVKLLTGPRLAILIVTNWATLIVTNWATSFSHYKNRGFRWFLWCSVISLCFFFVFSYFSVI